MHIENWFWIGFVGGGLSLLFAFLRLWQLLSLPRGDEPAQGLSAALRKGTNAYLKRQLLLSGAGLLLAFGCLEGLACAQLLNALLPFALLSGGLCGLLSGAVGAWLTAAGGPRAAGAAGKRLDRGLNAALRAGTAVSFLAVGLVLLHLTGWFFLLKYSMGYGSEDIAGTLLFFGLGSALASLLFRMGAVFACSAGMVAGTVDREMDLPPDDPRSPAAIAHQVGHGAGSAAGMASGLCCIYEALLGAALYLGQAAFAAADMAWNAMLLPLAVAAVGAVASLFGLLTVRPQEHGDRGSLPWCLRFSILVPALLTAVASFPITYLLMGSWSLCLPLLAGLGLGLLVPLAGDYFTSDACKPARFLAQTAETGTAAAAGGLGLGLCAAALPVLLAAAAFAAAFWSAGGMNSLGGGLYGLALAGVGMLSVSGTALASSLCGSVGDCAAHAAALTDAGEASRRRAEELSAIGAAAANGGKCLASISTGLMGLVLPLSLLPPEAELLPALPFLLLGILLGLGAVFLFLGLLPLAVRGGARAALLQARRQFQGNEALPDGAEAPDYAACVSRCSTRSLLGFVPPALLTLAAPAAVAQLLGGPGLMGFSGCVLTLSVALSLFFSLSGGILGGARRYVESGRLGGKGSGCHRALLTAEEAVASLSQAAGPALLALAQVTCLLTALFVTLL